MSDENLTHTCCWCQSAMDPQYAMCGDCWERELKRRETERDHALDDLKAEVANHREDEAKMKALEAQLLEQMDKEGTTQVRGKAATASVSETTVFNLTDDDAFFKFVHRNKYYHLLQRRLSAPAVREIFETKGVVPGCEPFVKRSVNLRAV